MTDEVLIKAMLLEMEYGFISYENLHGEDDRGIKLISKALEKQIQEKPTIVHKADNQGFHYNELTCKCGCGFWYIGKVNYCPKCGQSVDFGDYE